MPHPQSTDEIEEIALLFYRELMLHHSRSMDDLEDLFSNHVDENVTGIHAHYDGNPRGHRRRDHHEIPVHTLKSFYEEMFAGWSYAARLYHTLHWIKINEQTQTPTKYAGAVVAVIYEGIYVPSDTAIQRASSTSDGLVEIDKRAYHCHMSVYTLRKDHPFDDNVWKTHHVLSGLPAAGYRPKLNPHDYPDNIPSAEQVKVQPQNKLWKADVDQHDIALFIDVTADEPLANRFYGWEFAGNGRGLDDDC